MNATAMVSRVAHAVSNERVEGGCHRIVLAVDGGWPDTRPGQFTMLSLDHENFPILPRPFSLLGWDGRDRLEYLIMPVGVGTALLCSLRPGDAVNVVGPLGRPMDVALPGRGLVCVAGGYGIAPFLFLLEHGRSADVTVVFGARTAERLFLAERLQRTGARVELCTDDGSRAYHGRVSERLQELIEERRPELVLSCGPEAMMEAVGEVCRGAALSCRASLETVMGCGYAVCNGCAVPVRDEGQPDGYTYELACREGTVFDEERLRWSIA